MAIWRTLFLFEYLFMFFVWFAPDSKCAQPHMVFGVSFECAHIAHSTTLSCRLIMLCSPKLNCTAPKRMKIVNFQDNMVQTPFKLFSFFLCAHTSHLIFWDSVYRYMNTASLNRVWVRNVRPISLQFSVSRCLHLATFSFYFSINLYFNWLTDTGQHGCPTVRNNSKTVASTMCSSWNFSQTLTQCSIVV